MDEILENEAKRDRGIRGYIIRSLVKGFNYSCLVRQITNSLLADGLIISPDIGKYLGYLKDAGYIAFTDEKIKAHEAYSKDTVIRLTKDGVDLAQGVKEDPGVDV